MDCSDRAGLTPLYLSGELDGPRSAAFRAHLESCRGCAREIAEDAELDARLCREIRGEHLSSAKLEKEILRAMKRASFRRLLGIAATAAALAGIFAAGYWLRIDREAANLLAAAAQDHHREVVDHERRTWIADAPGVAALADRAGVEAELVAVVTPAGYHFDRAKLCRLGNSSFLHLVYSKNGAADVSIFLRHPDSALPDRIMRADLGPDSVAAFRTARADALIATDQPGDAALRLAQSAASVL